MNTDAAEDIKLDVLRELKRDEDFHQREIVLKYANRLPECVLRTPASTSKNVQLTDGFHRPEPRERFDLCIKDCNRHPALSKQMKEAGDVKQITQIDRQRDAEAEQLEKVVWLARNGGSFRLNTDAAEDIKLDVLREVECCRPNHLSAEIILKTANLLDALLDALSAGSFERFLQAKIQAPEQRERSQIHIKALHRQMIIAHFLESEHETLSYSSEMRKRESRELVDLTKWISRDGGKIALNTKAVGDVNASNVYDLVKRRETEAGSELKETCKREAEPLQLRTPESTSANITLGQVLSQPNAYLETDRLFNAVNAYPPQKYNCKESTACQEFTNFRYTRDEPRQESSIIVWEKRFGGKLGLNTRYAADDIVNISRLIEKQLDNFKRAEMTVVCANIAEPQNLNTKGTIESLTIIGCTFYHRDEVDKTSGSRRAANELRTEFKAKESTAVSETLNLRYTRDEQSASSSVVKDEARYGGRIAIGSNASQEVTTHCNSALDGNPTTDLRSPDFFIWLKNLAEPLRLNTPASSSSQSMFTSAFSRPNSEESFQHTLAIPRVCPALELRTKQSGIQTDQLNCDLQKPASNQQFAETRYIPRFGGAVSLNTKAAGSQQHLCESTLHNPRPTDLSCPHLIVIRREPDEHPRLNTIASSKDEKAISANLQRSEPYEQAQIKLVAARTIDSPSVRVTESREVEHLTNVNLNKPEAYEIIDTTRQEKRFGGSFKLDGKRSTDLIADCTRDLRREPSSESVEIVVKIPREIEIEEEYIHDDSNKLFQRKGYRAGIKLTTVHATTQEVDCYAEMENPYPTRNEMSITLKTANNAEPLKHNVAEAGHVNITTNVALQSGRRTEEEGEQTRREARFGGSYSMSTKASGEAMGGDTNVNLHRPEGNLMSQITVKISGREEPQRLDVSAAGDAAIGVDSRLERAEATQTCTHTAVTSLCEKLFLAATESGAERVDLTSIEVKRRLAEVQIEAVFPHAPRETSPVTLRSESAKQTVIRVDPPLMKPDENDPRRKQEIKHIVPEIVIIKPDEDFNIDAVDKVKLRRHYSNVEKAKEQKRQEALPRLSF